MAEKGCFPVAACLFSMVSPFHTLSSVWMWRYLNACGGFSRCEPCLEGYGFLSSQMKMEQNQMFNHQKAAV